ncbi:DUF1194 domain-containing protein [Phyllobacterium trifolii]|uniref:DUF1194 domain-containing protein n=1 Tax=Phyllobacterium trifolii TaxID=300193 RepID=UPI00161EB861
MALVLAVDGSSSITDEEYEFQKAAIVSAFRDWTVLSAYDLLGAWQLQPRRAPTLQVSRRQTGLDRPEGGRVSDNEATAVH